MIELLILFELSRKVLTMYGISKEIRDKFSVLTTPSYGTIKPALSRLQDSGFIKAQKTMSSGGRPSIYYSITNDGLEELKRLLTAQPLENPIQFLTSARIKLACAGVLNNEEQLLMFKRLKTKAESILIDAKNLIKTKELSYFPSMVFENLTCEYRNFISLVEGFVNAGSR